MSDDGCVKWTTAQLQEFRDHEVDDLVGDDVRLVFVGINPGLLTAATNTHFAHPTNRFYPALHRAGITAELLPSDGLNDAHRDQLRTRGVAITNIVARATAKASELTSAELRDGALALTERMERWRPDVVAVLGLTAYRTAFNQKGASAGEQAGGIAGARLFVLPNPSGLNAHASLDSLASAYAAAAVAAGVTVSAAD